MNVLHIFPSAFLGGSELCAIESIQALKGLGVNNYVILPTEGEVSNRLKQIDVEYIIIRNNWWMSAKPWGVLLKMKMLKGFYCASAQMARYMNVKAIDLVLTHSIVVPSGAIAAKRNRKPHIWYLHEYGDLDHQLHFEYGKRISLAIINALSRSVVVNSIALEKYFSKYFSIEKINKINYAVSYPDFNTVSAKYSEQLSICMVGRIAKGKNQLVALKALVHLRSQYIFPHLVLVGGADQTYLSELKLFIAQHQLEEQVVFVGQTNQPWDFVVQSEIVLVCSVMEAFGRVTIEAMKAGRLLIVSHTGAGPELIQDKVTGYLFDPENEKQLADILKLVWLQNDYAAMTEKSKAFAVQYFNLKSHGQALLNCMNEVL